MLIVTYLVFLLNSLLS